MDNELTENFNDIVSKKRGKYLTDLRRILVNYYLRQGLTTVFLGKLLNRDHSTISYHNQTHLHFYEYYTPYKKYSDRLQDDLARDDGYLRRLIKNYNNSKKN